MVSLDKSMQLKGDSDQAGKYDMNLEEPFDIKANVSEKTIPPFGQIRICLILQAISWLKRVCVHASSGREDRQLHRIPNFTKGLVLAVQTDHSVLPPLDIVTGIHCDIIYAELTAMSDNISPLPTSTISYEDISAALDGYFARGDGDMTPFSESEIQQISDLLSRVNRSWSLVPRTYIVLRISGRLHHLDTFINLGYTDYLFPVSREESLPRRLSYNARADFMKAQPTILTNAPDLEKGKEGKHQNFAGDQPLPFESRANLGVGSFGQVDKVVSVVSRKEYARRRIHRREIFEQAQMSMESYINELEVLKRIQHPHIVELVGSYTDPTFLGLIMSPVADCNLSEFFILIPTSLERTLLLRSFFGCLANALAHLHGLEIQHKDIRPSNILIEGDNVLVADFGLSCDSTDATRSMTEGITALSQRYCAPEVADYEPRSSSADIWSLGCVFLEMTTILKGITIDASKTVFNTYGSYGQHFRNNPNAAFQWIFMLRAIGLQSDNEPFDWISRMLQLDRYARPSAASLFEIITKSCSGSDLNARFSGMCCAEEGGGSPEDDSSFENAVLELQTLDIEAAEASNEITRPRRHQVLSDKPNDYRKGSQKPYLRPIFSRIFCDTCDDYPGGFRGDFELRRHHDRAHAERQRATWVTTRCLDPSVPIPEIPLESCRKCRDRKQYRDYYLATSHLRRAHFNPKLKREGNVRAEDKARRHDSDYPPLEVLCRWMIAVKEDVHGVIKPLPPI
ncbi:hypothetical protein GP486_007833 [Trichoglossum hirsutum]|uniref:EKC/KEOPS complex subunit BUD32 n=1 Tax=Trichoglossum hirsutum TaxID=265104 RepID=A0A9P8IGY5_9PEZI|nr:hypothetical protein GP486_007833 [Trichoglossum hirsutum]